MLEGAVKLGGQTIAVVLIVLVVGAMIASCSGTAVVQRHQIVQRPAVSADWTKSPGSRSVVTSGGTRVVGPCEFLVLKRKGLLAGTKALRGDAVAAKVCGRKVEDVVAARGLDAERSLATTGTRIVQ